MEYKLKPIFPQINNKESAKVVVDEIEKVINTMQAEGWEYMHMETVSTWVKGSNGCFGIGATQGYTMTVQILVFRK